jgi:hypothetical protein
MASYLQRTLGSALVAIILDIADANAVVRYASGRQKPRRAVQKRLLDTFQVVMLLTEAREAPDVIYAWFIGMNPALDGETPAVEISARPERVLDAARQFLAQASAAPTS